MRHPLEIVVASGKGGTGKTTVAAFLIYYLSGRFNVVGVDADVEAPDLAIALGRHREEEKEEIFDSQIATVDEDRCVLCGKCVNVCNFGAIVWSDGPRIVEQLCEGCGACAIMCDAGAISLRRTKTGEILFLETEYSPIVTGRLEIGRKHSGRLVEILKKEAKSRYNPEVIIVDAAAGIGCPVISSIAGSDMLIIVTEPTPQSLRSAGRVAEIGVRLGVKTGVLVNKYDLNTEFTKKIIRWSIGQGFMFLGSIPYDSEVVKAYVNMCALPKYAPHSKATEALMDICRSVAKWSKLGD